MNAGLSNLATLKAFVLPEALSEETTWDERLLAIGRGMAVGFEKFCNRKFTRAVGDVFTCSADRSYLCLARFPVESVASIAQKDDETTGFVVQPANIIITIDQETGIVEFGTPLGPHTSILRVTYTGGYHFETLEPDDDGYPSAVPEGAAVLPEDLQHAWLLACQKIFERTRALSTAGVREPDGQAQFLPSTKLDEGIQAMLLPYRRFA